MQVAFPVFQQVHFNFFRGQDLLAPGWQNSRPGRRCEHFHLKDSGSQLAVFLVRSSQTSSAWSRSASRNFRMTFFSFLDALRRPSFLGDAGAVDFFLCFSAEKDFTSPILSPVAGLNTSILLSDIGFSLPKPKNGSYSYGIRKGNDLNR